MHWRRRSTGWTAEPLGEPKVAADSPEELVRAAVCAGVTDSLVLEALRHVPREEFVPAAWRGLAYVDEPVPIGDGQVTTQPSLVARMVESLCLRGTERVLEVGTGLGYEAAVLGQLAREVISIECLPKLADQARENLRAHGPGNVTVVTGDGCTGLPSLAPYDAVVVAAAAASIPAPLVEQLVEGGRLVQPLGPPESQMVTTFRKVRGVLVEERLVVAARFVPLVRAHGRAPREGKKP